MILASLGLLGIAYTPKPKDKPSREFIQKVYVRSTGEQRWYASEKRKKEIMVEIRKIRKAIKLQAETYVDDRTKLKVSVYSNREKRNVHSYKLMASIANQLGI